jgi:hypothetical protein
MYTTLTYIHLIITYIHLFFINTEVTTAGKGKGLLWNLQNKLQSTGWLNLLADAMHNFTDGIAIGIFVLYVCMYVCMYVSMYVLNVLNDLFLFMYAYIILNNV